MSVLKRYTGTDWESIGGPAQSGTSVLSPDNTPASPNAADYEFDATSTSLPSGWSWFNQNTSTYREALGVGVMEIETAAAANADDVIGIMRAVPAGTSWLTTAKLTISSPRTSGSAFPAVGLFLSDGTKATTFWVASGGSTVTDNPSVVIDHYTNSSTWSSRPGAAFTPWALQTGLIYIRVRKNSASSYDMEMGPDGATWVRTHSAVNVSSLQTPTSIGVVVNTRGVDNMEAGCHWFRVT